MGISRMNIRDDNNNDDSGGGDYVPWKFWISVQKYVHSMYYEIIKHSYVMYLCRYKIMYT
jgi:hypothetical protein